MLVRPLRGLLRRSSVVSYFHSSSISWASQKITQKFKLADIGEGITECEIVKWYVKFRPSRLVCFNVHRIVKPQAIVQAFDPLCEVQSDKASVEITSPYDGVLKELLVQEGEVAKVGSGLCLIEVEVENATESSDTHPPEPVPPLVKEASASTPSIVNATESRRFHPLDPNSMGLKVENVFAAPSVRHFARQKGIDLALLVPGRGKDGRVEKADVEAYINRDTAQSISPPPPQKGCEDVILELGRTRYGMWKAMVKVSPFPFLFICTFPQLFS